MDLERHIVSKIINEFITDERRDSVAIINELIIYNKSILYQINDRIIDSVYIDCKKSTYDIIMNTINNNKVVLLANFTNLYNYNKIAQEIYNNACVNKSLVILSGHIYEMNKLYDGKLGGGRAVVYNTDIYTFSEYIELKTITGITENTFTEYLEFSNCNIFHRNNESILSSVVAYYILERTKTESFLNNIVDKVIAEFKISEKDVLKIIEYLVHSNILNLAYNTVVNTTTILDCYTDLTAKNKITVINILNIKNEYEYIWKILNNYDISLFKYCTMDDNTIVDFYRQIIISDKIEDMFLHESTFYTRIYLSNKYEDFNGSYNRLPIIDIILRLDSNFNRKDLKSTAYLNDKWYSSDSYGFSDIREEACK